MPSAWINQDAKQVKKHGADAASWYVGWIDPEGKRRCKSCGPGEQGKRNADKLRKKREAELITGTYQANSKTTWDDFRADYEAKVLGGLAVRTREEVTAALDHFERIVKPKKPAAIKTTTNDGIIADRRSEAGKKKGDLVSPATVNKDLRHLRAALAVAQEWGYLSTLPKFRMEKTVKKLPRYMPGDHFAAVYTACEHATRPAGKPYLASDWWRGLLVAGYMTGWRIGELLALDRQDLDLDGGFAITRGDDNKGKRDERAALHPIVVAHLRKLVGFDPHVFPWSHNKTTLYEEFGAIQTAAKINLPCRKAHEHTDACHVYGFHDLRRAFATMNADRLTPDALQALMRHKSYSTTQLYINMARQMNEAVAGLHVPEVLKKSQV
jgi:integrase